MACAATAPAWNRPVRCVVFDFDDTLLKSEHVKCKILFQMASCWPGGVKHMQSIMMQPSQIRGERYDIMKSFIARTHPSSSAEDCELRAQKMAHDYSDRVLEGLRCCDEVNGANALLQKLHGMEVPVYVNSATPINDLRKAIDCRGWAHFFRGVLGSPRTKLENLQTVAKWEGLEPREIVMIGDGNTDRQAAASFCCPFIGVGSQRQFSEPVPVLVKDLQVGSVSLMRWLHPSLGDRPPPVMGPSPSGPTPGGAQAQPRERLWECEEPSCPESQQRPSNHGKPQLWYTTTMRQRGRPRKLLVVQQEGSDTSEDGWETVEEEEDTQEGTTKWEEEQEKPQRQGQQQLFWGDSASTLQSKQLVSV